MKGFLTATPLCGSQVGPKGRVIGIDHIKELVDDSINNVKKDDSSLITSGRVQLTGGFVLRGGDVYLFVSVIPSHQATNFGADPQETMTPHRYT